MSCHVAGGTPHDLNTSSTAAFVSFFHAFFPDAGAWVLLAFSVMAKAGSCGSGKEGRRGTPSFERSGLPRGFPRKGARESRGSDRHFPISAVPAGGPCEGGTSEMSARPVSTESRNMPLRAACALAFPYFPGTPFQLIHAIIHS